MASTWTIEATAFKTVKFVFQLLFNFNMSVHCFSKRDDEASNASVKFSNSFQNFKVNNRWFKLTDCAHLGKYQVDPTKRCVCNMPFTTLRSMTSVPITAGFIGLGYFLHAACATVSQGWLEIKMECNQKNVQK